MPSCLSKSAACFRNQTDLGNQLDSVDPTALYITMYS